MKIIRKIIYFAAAFVLVFIAFWFGYLRYTDKTTMGAVGDANNTPLKVVAETIGTANINETIAVTGSFEALKSVEIIPEITGRLEQLRLPDGTLIDVGVAVKADDIVAVIEHAALDTAVQQGRAGLQTAKASLETAKVTFENAEREKKRMEGLYKGGAIPEQQYDAASTAYDRAKAGLAVAQAGVEQAEAALTSAKVTLDKATIKAPITGLVSKKYTDEGNMVGPTTPLIRIVQIETLKVLGGVSERYLRDLVPGETTVHIKTDAYPEDEFQGVVYRVGVAVDTVTRTGQVEIRVPNPDMRLKPGMFARMTIVLQERENVVTVPDSALIREQGNVYVFVANAGKAHRRGVKLGLLQNEYYEMLEGLSVGELVVTRGRRQIEDGQAIEVIQEIKK
jgi:RND family efflux transporter MFP subunit